MVWNGNLFGYYQDPGQGGPVMPPPVATPPVTTPVTTPTTPGQQTPAQLAQWVHDLLGGQRGQQNGMAGGGSGVGGQQQGGGQSYSGGGGEGSLFGGTTGGAGGYPGINVGTWGNRVWQGMGALPYGIGTASSLAHMLAQGYNTYKSNQTNQALGGPGLDIGQMLGGLLGLNGYGDLTGNQTYANQSGLPGRPGTAVTAGGMYDAGFMGGGPFGVFSDPRSAYTPQEYVERRNTDPNINPNTAAGIMASLSQKQMIDQGLTYDPTTGRVVGGNNGNYVSDRAGMTIHDSGGLTGYGGNDSTSVGSSGQFGHMASGGFVPGDPGVGDNQPIAATPGEFVITRHAAQILGPGILNMLNDPGHAGMLRDAIGRAEHMAHNKTASSAKAAADLMALIEQEMAAGQAPQQPGPMQDAPQMGQYTPQEGLPVPMDKPPQPAQGSVEGGWSFGQRYMGPPPPAVNISGSGHAKPKARGMSESDRLNQQELARIKARRAAAGK